jgi:predicted nucleotidyltransferase component of viral defense system
MAPMILREEIEEKAKEFEIHPTNVERDYVFGWFLSGLFTVSDLKGNIFLKGGNALRKGYFANTRFSSDLDFGIEGDINQDVLLAEINKVCDFIQEKAGVNFVKEDNKIEEKFTATETPIPGLKVYEARIYFKDFNGGSDHMKIKISMDITRFDKILLDIQEVDLIHLYSDANNVACKIRCMKLEEIIATKLKCLMQRQHAPDLFDYVHSIRLLGGTLNREEVVETFVKKTIFEKNPYVLKGILSLTAFDYFRLYWAKGVLCAKQLFIDVEDAISTFIADLESLFGIYSDNGFAQFVYFRPEDRAVIMKAGRDQTLLKVNYNGSDRMIEPYSLKYLEKRSGDEKEYFYVYNLSGGSSAPGIRSFLPQGLQSIENTEEKFSPRFPVELSKHGETPDNPYLFDPNRPTPAPRQRATRSVFGSTPRPRRNTFSGGLKYTYQCGMCGKKMTKGRQDSTIGPHKSKGGHYPCPGRFGIYVGIKY